MLDLVLAGFSLGLYAEEHKNNALKKDASRYYMVLRYSKT